MLSVETLRPIGWTVLLGLPLGMAASVFRAWNPSVARSFLGHEAFFRPAADRGGHQHLLGSPPAGGAITVEGGGGLAAAALWVAADPGLATAKRLPPGGSSLVDHDDRFPKRWTCDIRLALQNRFATSLDLSPFGVTNDAVVIQGAALRAGPHVDLAGFVTATYEDIRAGLLQNLPNLGLDPESAARTRALVIPDMEPGSLTPDGTFHLGDLGEIAADPDRRPYLEQIISGYLCRVAAVRSVFPRAKLGLFQVVNPDFAGRDTSVFLQRMRGYRLAGERGLYDDIDYLVPALYPRRGPQSLPLPVLQAQIEAAARQAIEAALTLTTRSGRRLPLAPLTTFWVFSGGVPDDRLESPPAVMAAQLRVLQQYPAVRIIGLWSGWETPEEMTGGPRPVQVIDFEQYLRGVGPERDLDGDGFATRSPLCGGPDCDDTRVEVHPGAVDRCDGLDNDCDGLRDDRRARRRFFTDVDGDGFGNRFSWVWACRRPEGFSRNRRDCDDTDPIVNPEAEDVCDGIDNDCNGTRDDHDLATWYGDADRDGFGDDSTSFLACANPLPLPAGFPPFFVQVGSDCDDAHLQAHPAAAEICDGRDNDCDGVRDQGFAVTRFFADRDLDGLGDPDNSALACQAPFRFTTDGSDPDDTPRTCHPPGEGEGGELGDGARAPERRGIAPV